MVAWWLGVGMLAASPGEPALHRFEFAQVEMAVPVKITLYAKNQEAASRAAEAAFSRFHALNAIMSDYDPESELNRLCDTAGQGKAVQGQRRPVEGAGPCGESLCPERGGI